MNKRIDSIQGARGMSAILIAYIFHYLLLFQAMPVNNIILVKIFQIIGTLYIFGSDVFFVFSGFLMYQGYEGRLSNGEVSFRKYMLPRVIKIYPLVIVTAIINFAIEQYGRMQLGYFPLHGDGGELRYSIGALIANIIGTQSGWISDGDALAVNGPSWFISILMICYVLYYLITRFVHSEKVRLVIYWLMMGLGILLFLAQLNVPLLYRINGRGYFAFFGGILMNHYVSRWKEAAKIWMSLAALIAIVVSVTCSIPFNEDRLWITMVIMWPACVYLTIYAPWVRAQLSIRPLVKLGDYAMSIFLCNMPINTLMEYLNQRYRWGLDYENTLVWIAYIGVSLVISWGMYQVFEKRVPEWLRNKIRV